MSNLIMEEEYKHLTVPERISMVEEIWDSIADENANVKLTAEHKNLLEQRLKSYNQAKKRTTWDAIKKRIKSKRRK